MSSAHEVQRKAAQRKLSNEIIGETFGMDVAEVNEARYQSTRTESPVYAISDLYFCCPVAGKKPPKGWDWKAHTDQFFAAPHGRTVYVASTEVEA